MNKEEKIGQDQLYNLLLEEDLGWQALIYDLINTEQLDPWDINISILAEKYLEKIQELEEANFIISSKILLAAALLLRIKSEILLNHYIKSLDEILFGKKEEKKYQLERIELDEDIPELIPRTPLPRHKKVTLQELMSALNKAISTEQRRIHKKTIQEKLAKEAEIVLPKRNINIRDKIREIYSKLKFFFKDEKKVKIAFTKLAGKSKKEKIMIFVPLLHLDNQQKVWLEQENHFDEIYVWLKETYVKENREKILEELRESEEQALHNQSEINQFENPLANFFDINSEVIKGNVR